MINFVIIILRMIIFAAVTSCHSFAGSAIGGFSTVDRPYFDKYVQLLLPLIGAHDRVASS